MLPIFLISVCCFGSLGSVDRSESATLIALDIPPEERRDAPSQTRSPLLIAPIVLHGGPWHSEVANAVVDTGLSHTLLLPRGLACVVVTQEDGNAIDVCDTHGDGLHAYHLLHHGTRRLLIHFQDGTFLKGVMVDARAAHVLLLVDPRRVRVLDLSRRFSRAIKHHTIEHFVVVQQMHPTVAGWFRSHRLAVVLGASPVGSYQIFAHPYERLQDRWRRGPKSRKRPRKLENEDEPFFIGLASAWSPMSAAENLLSASRTMHFVENAFLRAFSSRLVAVAIPSARNHRPLVVSVVNNPMTGGIPSVFDSGSAILRLPSSTVVMLTPMLLRALREALSMAYAHEALSETLQHLRLSHGGTQITAQLLEGSILCPWDNSGEGCGAIKLSLNRTVTISALTNDTMWTGQDLMPLCGALDSTLGEVRLYFPVAPGDGSTPAPNGSASTRRPMDDTTKGKGRMLAGASISWCWLLVLRASTPRSELLLSLQMAAVPRGSEPGAAVVASIGVPLFRSVDIVVSPSAGEVAFGRSVEATVTGEEGTAKFFLDVTGEDVRNGSPSRDFPLRRWREFRANPRDTREADPPRNSHLDNPPLGRNVGWWVPTIVVVAILAAWNRLNSTTTRAIKSLMALPLAHEMKAL